MIIVEQGLVTINIPKNTLGNLTYKSPEIYVTKTYLGDNYYNKEEVDELIGGGIDLTDYYTKTEVDELIENVEVDLTGYATEQWVENKNYLTSIPYEYVTETELNNKGYLTSIPDEYITETELNSKDFATNSDVNDEIGKLDSALSGEIGKKQDTLVSGENIKTINGNTILGSGDIVIEGGEGANIVYLTQAEYDALVDAGTVDAETLYLISDATINTNFKTINGESIIGDGDIVIEGGDTDLSNYYTKTEVDTLIENVDVDLTGYATTSYVSENYQVKGDYLTSIPDEYITESELTAKNYATKSEIPTIPTNVSSFTNDAGYITNSALDGYATETYVSDTYQVKGNYLTSVPDEYVTDTELTDKGYATTTYVDNQIGNINTILENIIG